MHCEPREQRARCLEGLGATGGVRVDGRESRIRFDILRIHAEQVDHQEEAIDFAACAADDVEGLTLTAENLTSGEVLLTTTALSQLPSNAWPTPTSVGVASMPTISDDLRFVAYQASTKIMVQSLANGSYGSTQIVSAGTSNTGPVLAASASGEAILGFYANQNFYVSKLDSSGGWVAPVVGSDSVFGWGDPQLSIDGAGDGLLAIQQSEPMALVLNHSTGVWLTNALANDGTGLTMSADPATERAAVMWVDMGRQAIKTMLLD